MIVYEFARAAAIDGWWLWAFLLLGIVAALVLCAVYYRRDAAELPRPVRWTLIGLRLTAVLALVFLFFDLVRRTERQITRQSEVIVMVDTSQSMSLPSGDSLDSPTRTQYAVELLENSKLIDTCDDEHRTSVYAIGGVGGPRFGGGDVSLAESGGLKRGHRLRRPAGSLDAQESQAGGGGDLSEQGP